MDVVNFLYILGPLAGIGVLLFFLGQLFTEADWQHPLFNFIDGLTRLFVRYYHGFSAPKIPLPETGPAIVVSNHISGLDPLLLVAATRRPLRFLIATEEYHRFGLQWLFRAAGCIPVDRKGKPERALREALRALDRGEVIALFPHGKIHLDTDPPRRLKPGVVRLAQHGDVPIYPVRLDHIRGAGHVIPALVLRGQPKLTQHPAMHCRADTDPDACLERIATLIEHPMA